MGTHYSAVCTDIDGTLLDRNRQLSARTIQAIRSIKDRVPIILASSRMPSALRHLQVQLDITEHPIICYNGGYILRQQVHSTHPEILGSTQISLDVCLQIIVVARKWPVHVSLYADDEWYVAKQDKWADREESITKVSPKIREIEQVLADWTIRKSGAHKIMIMGEAHHIRPLYEELERYYNNSVHIYRSKDTYLELAPKQISKASALELVVRKWYGLPISEVIAFGDNYNDIEMIHAAGLGIVVNNAREEVKAVADEITLDSREDGVAIALEKYTPVIVAHR
jgi:Cof subfamily protein (haloacid dehalogenase superfamily)